MNKISVFGLGFVAGIFSYIIAWSGWSEPYKLQPLIMAKEGCYFYSNEDDIKNIARRTIINAAKGLEVEVIAQKRFTVMDEGKNYYITGWPQHLVKVFDRIFNRPYIPTMTVILEKDASVKCVYIKEALYQKD